ncbi:WecB/TagA/CpsF family glycosyltransferase [Cohnella sp.]|uniref:WecB/TagA/CpsF family glycosyltransferase n=1 Tax=Cohnella sp. TaxID=1883426 RepID=UPI003561FAF5
MKIPSYELLGIKVHALNETELMAYVQDCIRTSSETRVIGNHNLHSVYLMHHTADMRRYYERADLIHIDGMPIIWLGRLFGCRLNRSHRLTSMDWLPRLFRECEEQGRKIFLLGSRPGVAEKAIERFHARFPGLSLAGHHGYFDKTPGSADNENVIDLIRSWEPDLVLVGMGMPIQENWILQNAHRLGAKVVWSLGAFMDYYADVKPLPPRWMGRLGLEWLYRLVSEPRRLWKRYVLEPWYILFLLMKTVIKR